MPSLLATGAEQKHPYIKYIKYFRPIALGRRAETKGLGD